MPLELPDDIRRSVTEATAITAPGVAALLDHLGDLATEHATDEPNVHRSAALEAASAVYMRAAGAVRTEADRPGTRTTASILALVREADQLVQSGMREYDAHAILVHLAAPGSDDFQSSAPDRRLRQPAARQVTDAWKRIATWLEGNAPASHAALLPGAARRDVGALERLEQWLNPGVSMKNPSPSVSRHRLGWSLWNAPWFCDESIAARPHRSVLVGPLVATRVSASNRTTSTRHRPR